MTLVLEIRKDTVGDCRWGPCAKVARSAEATIGRLALYPLFCALCCGQLITHCPTSWPQPTHPHPLLLELSEIDPGPRQSTRLTCPTAISANVRVNNAWVTDFGRSHRVTTRRYRHFQSCYLWYKPHMSTEFCRKKHGHNIIDRKTYQELLG